MILQMRASIVCGLLLASGSVGAVTPGQPWVAAWAADRNEPSAERHDDSAVVPLNQVVSQVQRQFNATAVKADVVREDGQLVYRIRLLSADRSRVWTVNVDARTGQLR